MVLRQDVYVIDASSLIALGDVYTGEDLERAWMIIENLATSGRLKTSEFAFEEVRRNDSATYNRIRSLRRFMIEKIDQRIFSEAGRISALYPIMSKINRDRDTADPWIIAIAKLRGVKVVCEEGAAKPQRMPSVCTKERLRCSNIVDMLAENGMPHSR